MFDTQKGTKQAKETQNTFNCHADSRRFLFMLDEGLLISLQLSVPFSGQPFGVVICLPSSFFIFIIIIIIIIISIIITIPFMQGIYKYIPETNHVPKEYNVAVILSLLFMAPHIVSSCFGSNVLLRQHFPNYMCRAQYASFLQFPNFVVSWYGAHVFSE
jgi:hypothetical protein